MDLLDKKLDWALSRANGLGWWASNVENTESKAIVSVLSWLVVCSRVLDGQGIFEAISAYLPCQLQFCSCSCAFEHILQIYIRIGLLYNSSPCPAGVQINFEWGKPEFAIMVFDAMYDALDSLDLPGKFKFVVRLCQCLTHPISSQKHPWLCCLLDYSTRAIAVLSTRSSFSVFSLTNL